MAGRQPSVLTGFEVFNFTDGTVNNNDGQSAGRRSVLLRALSRTLNAHGDADATTSCSLGRGAHPNAFFDTKAYIAAKPERDRLRMNPLDYYDLFGWQLGTNPRQAQHGQIPTAYRTSPAAHVDPLAQFLFLRRAGRAMCRLSIVRRIAVVREPFLCAMIPCRLGRSPRMMLALNMPFGACPLLTRSGQQPAVFPTLTARPRPHNFNEHPRSPKVRGEASPHRRIFRIDHFIQQIVIFEQTHAAIQTCALSALICRSREVEKFIDAVAALEQLGFDIADIGVGVMPAE